MNDGSICSVVIGLTVGLIAAFIVDLSLRLSEVESRLEALEKQEQVQKP